MFLLVKMEIGDLEWEIVFHRVSTYEEMRHCF